MNYSTGRFTDVCSLILPHIMCISEKVFIFASKFVTNREVVNCNIYNTSCAYFSSCSATRIGFRTSIFTARAQSKPDAFCCGLIFKWFYMVIKCTFTRKPTSMCVIKNIQEEDSKDVDPVCGHSHSRYLHS